MITLKIGDYVRFDVYDPNLHCKLIQFVGKLKEFGCFINSENDEHKYVSGMMELFPSSGTVSVGWSSVFNVVGWSENYNCGSFNNELKFEQVCDVDDKESLINNKIELLKKKKSALDKAIDEYDEIYKEVDDLLGPEFGLTEIL